MGKEYEIDFISQAEVFGGAYRRYWRYTVHWKGYGAEESTQEPLKSFQPTSTNKKSAVPIVEAFWKSLNYDGIPKASAFEKGHIECRKGPPKRKREAWSEGSSESSTKDLVAAGATQDLSLNAVPSPTSEVTASDPCPGMDYD